MDPLQLPPPLVRPEMPEKPRGSWLRIALVGFAGLAIAIILTFLTIGFFGPFLILGLALFGIIGLQYIVWGWWFERVYRAPRDESSTTFFPDDATPPLSPRD